MDTHSTPNPVPLSLPLRVRILGRKIGYGFNALPDWAQDGLIAWLIALPLWLLLIGALLVF